MNKRYRVAFWIFVVCGFLGVDVQAQPTDFFVDEIVAWNPTVIDRVTSASSATTTYKPGDTILSSGEYKCRNESWNANVYGIWQAKLVEHNGPFVTTVDSYWQDILIGPQGGSTTHEPEVEFDTPIWGVNLTYVSWVHVYFSWDNDWDIEEIPAPQAESAFQTHTYKTAATGGSGGQ